jgi:hypothetical protein
VIKERKKNMAELMEPIYDRRVNETLAGLMQGRTREEISKDYKMTNQRSLDNYMRRRGFTWERDNQTYVPATTKADNILEELDSGAPFKAEMIMKRFEEMGEDSDPMAIADEFSFSDHREMGEYMESKHLFWNSDKKNYVLKVLDCEDGESEESVDVEDKAFQRNVHLGDNGLGSLKELETYLPLLDLLLQNKERLVTMLMPQTSGTLPRYTLPGNTKNQTLYMSEVVIRLMKEFCKSKNVKQKEVLEVALVEFFKRYGYQREIDKLLGKA